MQSSLRKHEIRSVLKRVVTGMICTSDLSGAAGAPVIALEAECCSLDSLGAFTDEHYCGPAVTRCMHSYDKHSQMWVGSGLTSTARSPISSNLHRDSNGKKRKMSLLADHISRGAIDRSASHRTVRMSLRCRIRFLSPCPLLTPGELQYMSSKESL